MSTLKAVRGTRDLLPPETELWKPRRGHRRARSSRATASAKYARPSLRTRSSSPAAWARRPISSRRKCTPGRIARGRSRKSRNRSPCAPRTPPAWSAPTSNTNSAKPACCKSLLSPHIGPQFRRERPQKGRYRQFWQIGAEVIGPPSAGSESPLRRRRDSGNAGQLPRRIEESPAGRSR